MVKYLWNSFPYTYILKEKPLSWKKATGIHMLQTNGETYCLASTKQKNTFSFLWTKVLGGHAITCNQSKHCLTYMYCNNRSRTRESQNECTYAWVGRYMWEGDIKKYIFLATTNLAERTNISNYRASTTVCTAQQKNLAASLYNFVLLLFIHPSSSHITLANLTELHFSAFLAR